MLVLNLLVGALFSLCCCHFSFADTTPWVRGWKNFENWSTFGEVVIKCLVSCFFFDSR